jgi:hypothetical protein
LIRTFGLISLRPHVYVEPYVEQNEIQIIIGIAS